MIQENPAVFKSSSKEAKMKGISEKGIFETTFNDLRNWLGHALHFYSNALRHPFQVASFGPTFPYVARQIAEILEGSKVFIELGPGTGIVSEELIRQAVKLILIEANSRYVEVLKERFSEKTVSVYEDRAENLSCIFKAEQFLTPDALELDAVVTSIPFSVLTEEVRRSIINEALSCLKPGGKIVSFQHTHVADKCIREVCSENGHNVAVTTNRIWRHLPPLVITTATLGS